MIVHFFWEVIKNISETVDSNAAIKEIAERLIAPPHFHFTHEDYDHPDSAHNFRSQFILKLIASAHLSKTTSAIDVPSLSIAKLQKGYGMECVIALAAAAVQFHCIPQFYALTVLLSKLERAINLVREGFIDVQNAVDEMAGKKGKMTLPKSVNKATGNMSKGKFMFSMSNWGSETRSYVVAVAKKGQDNTADIIASARVHLGRGPLDSASGSSGSGADTVDPRSCLCLYGTN
ncbi:hypothetical protein JVU11DRAFT_8791 [Chiua virens]|nr:hypothetical protein JVU11DRAFT_8791 [Chiua virens]